MELMNQPFTGQLGNRLIELLESSDYHTLNIVVAFAKNSGVLRIKNSLERFRERGGKVNVYVGVDLCGTSYEALTALLINTNSLQVVHSERGQTFHAKIYQFLGNDQGLIIVGSHNLTGGGLWTNFESSVHIPIGGSNENEGEILSTLNTYIKELTLLNDSFMPITSQDDIEKLLQNGYIFKEVAEQVRLATSAEKAGTPAGLFGNGVPALIPRITMPQVEEIAAVIVAPQEPATLPQGDESQTLWFETREMTGGSTNILDLSKRSLVERGDPKGTPYDIGSPRFIRGTVEFFGQNPAAIDQTKNITINFEGIDYIGNTILYPVGKKKNGTWRLQMRGSSSAEEKITDIFKAKGGGDYLKNKVITFSKIQDNYYSMSVFPESELENFKVASRILARNGSASTSRQIGLL